MKAGLRRSTTRAASPRRGRKKARLAVLPVLVVLALTGFTGTATASGLAGWTSISAGYDHSCGLANGGKGRCWGNNDYGQATVPTLSDGATWVSISAGRSHSCGVTSTGEALCWGHNQYGDATVPSLTGGATWVSISAGYVHSCGLTSTGAALCWGLYKTGDTALPTLSGGATWVLISGGAGHSCGVTSTGQGLCWGSNTSGETTVPTLTAGETWVSITAGNQHSCGLTSTGQALCWGNSTSGRTVVPALSGGATWVSISAGHIHSCGVTSTGLGRCWGYNPNGQTTVPTLPAGATWASISAGDLHSCGLTSTHETLCWGDNSFGQLAVPDMIAPTSPTSFTGVPPSWTNSTSATLGFALGETVAGGSVECALDGAWTDCTSGVTGTSGSYSVSSLSEGSHTVSVSQTDAVGNVSDPGTNAWTVDTTAPATPDSFTGVPTRTNSTTATIGFTLGEAIAGGSVECRLDSGSWTDCTSDVTGTSGSSSVPFPPYGSHTFGVRQTDAAGNVSDVGTTDSWTVDTAAPASPASFTGVPSNWTKATHATIGFTLGEAIAGGSVECRLDSGSWTDCTSGVTGTSGSSSVPFPPYGSHTFGVRQTDAAGNVSDPSTTDSWAVGFGATGWTSISSGEYSACGVTNTGFGLCWGPNFFGDATVPYFPEGVTWTSISSGAQHACGLTSTGEALCWGNTGKGRTTVPTLPTGATWVSVSAGYAHSCGLTSTGQVLCWGLNDFGETDIPIMRSDWTWSVVSAGGIHSCGVTNTGYGVCWGANDYGQTEVPTLSAGSTWVSISAGHTHSCGLTTNGQVLCWGEGAFGATTVPTLPFGSTWVSISAGYLHSCGVTSTGEALCWGNNSWGRTTVPTLAAGATWVSVSAGYGRSCGVTSTGAGLCWGENRDFVTSVPDPFAPAAPDSFNGVPPSLTNSTSATIDFTLGETVAGGSVECRLDSDPWTDCSNDVTGTTGSHALSSLSDGLHRLSVRQTDAAGNMSNPSTTDSWTVDATPPAAPASFIGVPSSPLNPSVATIGFTLGEAIAGGSVTCRLDDGPWRPCSGVRDLNGAFKAEGLLSGSHTVSVRQIDAAGNESVGTSESWTVGTSGWSSISTGQSYACGVGRTGQALCWGNNDNGQATVPTLSAGVTWDSISSGDTHSCGVTSTGQGRCWGVNDYGQTEVPTLSAGSTWVSISAGSTHSCGMTSLGEARCWGNNNRAMASAPSLPAEGSTWTSVSAGYTHSCGLTTTGQALCWGYDDNGALAVPDLPEGVTWTSIKAGNKNTCGVTSAGQASCWGSIGDWHPGDVGRRNNVPALPAGSTWVSISPGRNHSCGLTSAGQARCWGNNDSGQTNVPIMRDGSTWVSISVRSDNTCGVTTTGQARCWGNNDSGQTNVTSTPWSADITEPSAPSGLSGIPSSPTNSSSATIHFTVDEGVAGGIVECALDGEWTDCTSDVSGKIGAYALPLLLPGTHNVSVRQTDAAGNVSDVATTDSWTIDGTPPTAPDSFTGVPSNPSSSSAATIGFTLGELGVSVKCRLDELPWRPCSSVRELSGVFRVEGLFSGLHTVSVSQIDAAGNESVGKSHSWTVGTSGWSSISAGAAHTCGVTLTGQGRCWGTSNNARTTVPTLSAGATWVSISAGYTHSCGLTTNGQVLCWGNNDNGQTVVPTESIDQQVPAGFTWTSVSAGNAQSCGQTSTGKGLCWGDAGYSATNPRWPSLRNTFSVSSGGHQTCFLVGNEAPLGHYALCEGPSSTWSQPGPEGGTWTSISAGDTHWCALASTSEALCWGNASNGRTTVPTLPTGATWVSVSAGYAHSCGLTSTGQVLCWGLSTNGRTTVPTLSGGATWVSVSAGGAHSCGLTSTGEAICWGDNSYGQGTKLDTIAPTAPASFTGVPSSRTNSPVATISFTLSEPVAGGSVECRLDSGSWTDCTSGVTGTTGSYALPLLLPDSHSVSVRQTDAAGNVSDVATTSSWTVDATAPAAPGSFTGVPSSPSGSSVALIGFTLSEPVEGGSIQCRLDSGLWRPCWGVSGVVRVEGLVSGSHTLSVRQIDAAGNVGDAGTTDPWTVGTSGWSSISSGGAHSCGLNRAGQGRCWGSSSNSQTTVPTLSAGATWTLFSAGYAHSCGVTNTGQGHCWGNNSNAQTTLPTLSAGATWASISAGSSHSCGVTNTGQGRCWGLSTNGRTTVPTLPNGSTWGSISAGGAHSCGLTSRGQALCWGSNDKEQRIVPALSGAATWTSISAGYMSSCGVTSTGQALCWGDNSDAQTAVPTLPAGATWTSISAGISHSCGLTSTGQARCWGLSTSGRTTVPTLSAGATWVSVSAGGAHSCGLTSTGETLCWGDNSFGQLTMVDVIAPATPGPFSGVPASPSSSTSATVGFTIGEAVAGGSVDCRLDSGSWTACTSTVTGTSGSYAVSSLADGAHTVSVRQTDAGGNVSSTGTSSAWTVRTTAPAAPALSGKPASTTPLASQNISWTAEANATFTCSVDAGTYSACTSPAVRTGLASGAHSFSVKATNQAGKTSPAATTSWTVTGGCPKATITNPIFSDLGHGHYWVKPRASVGTSRAACQLLTVQIWGGTTKPADSDNIPSTPSAQMGILKYATTVRYSLSKTFTPKWIRIQNKLGTWSTWYRLGKTG